MEEQEYVILKIIFNYNLIENVDKVLQKVTILQKSFTNKEITYFIKLNKEYLDQVINIISKSTYNLAKFEIIEKREEIQEVGTDKPLGSKAAIDEN